MDILIGLLISVTISQWIVVAFFGLKSFIKTKKEAILWFLPIGFIYYSFKGIKDIWKWYKELDK